ncbi:MerR family DNA-binding transcriptional regulator [Bacillus atrophaeus]
MMNIPAHTIRYYESEGLLPFLRGKIMGIGYFEKKIWVD